MRDLLKILMVGIIIFFAPTVSAESYKLLILPDNIVTENIALDSYIYNAASEFFADEITALLNFTDNIKSQNVSEVRAKLKSNPSAMLSAKALMERFRTTYNVDYESAKKLANQTGNRYVLLLTSTIDAENYILRRTVWDFFNIAGASVVDPAYKINTYAVLIDTLNSKKLWSDTYYKTISTVENRIITRGQSPQTEQLSRIKDYSRYICPQIAQNVQVGILPEDVMAKESTVIDYDLGNIDNVFTKKYRHIGKENRKIYNQKKEKTKSFVESIKEKYNQAKIKRREQKAEKQNTKLEVKAQPVYEDEKELNKINSTIKNDLKTIKSTAFRKEINDNQLLIEPIEIKKTYKNNLFGQFNDDKPYLREYSKL
ncbi:MAG: hypothetical protein MJ230_07145 [bacterium]|nr:hypothetical protein [bacterium]